MGKTIVDRLKVINTKGLYLLAIVSIAIYSLVLGWAYVLIFKEQPSEAGMDRATSGFEGFKTFFLAMVIAPFFETLIKQFLIIEGLSKFRYLSNRVYIPILISALCFSLGHYYSLYYIVYAFGAGLVLAIFYAILM